MANKDKQLLETIISKAEEKISKILKEEDIIKNNNLPYTDDNFFSDFEFPLNKNILDILKKLNTSVRTRDDDFILFSEIETIKTLWKELIITAIKCLRFFDKREPFLAKPNKKPQAYGINDLVKYFNDYTVFENLLYGGGKFYRDHIIHVFRVWILGIHILLQENKNVLYIQKISYLSNTNSFEKLSIWTLISLTHDLGYPLEKTQGVLEKTREMMKSFIYNPNLSFDVSFNGVQNNMNDFVIRFISSKMTKSKNDNEKFVARLQPKYYFKFQKSLEKYSHGIISSIIIYKLLTYFLESDFNINEDYYFTEEDVRQFYIRREILRSIASHTCNDVYHLTLFDFSFLLIIADDCQEWGRKRLSELYVDSTIEYILENIIIDYGSSNENKNNLCKICEEIKIEDSNDSILKSIIKNLYDQFMNYSIIFRDGQDTINRDFIFKKQIKIKYSNTDTHNIEINYEVKNDEKSSFNILLEKQDDTLNVELKKHFKSLLNNNEKDFTISQKDV